MSAARILSRIAVPVLVLLRSLPCQAVPATGFPAEPDCTALARLDSAELYVLGVNPGNSSRTNDWLWNIENKGEVSSDAQALIDPSGSWAVGDVWGEGTGGATFAFMTFPDGILYADTNDPTSVDFGVAPVQRVGDSLPVGRDAGIGLQLPGTAAQYQVTMAPGITRTFPMATTSGALVLAFSPIAEVNPLDAVPGTCQIGGNAFHPRDTTRGAIIGYNVYRLPACSCTPTAADFHRAMITDDDSDGGWIAFVDLRTFDVTVADGRPGLPGTPAPSDLVPDDLFGLQNPDGRMYSGDEVLLFADDGNITRPRSDELAPRRGLSYWYALQPVVFGTVSSFASLDFTINDFFAGDHRMDVDGDGEFDAVSLNSVAPAHDTPEFYSPQAEPENGGQDGLGLTHRGMALLGSCFFMDLSLPLPATGQVSLQGRSGADGLELILTTGLETSDVLGYNVVRVSGAHRVRVNDAPILAQGGESNVYSLIDDSARPRGAKPLDYVVETLMSDGSPSAFSNPFSVTLDLGDRRRR
jgi:hypothetical protein